ncbi:MAG: Uncharacterized protein Greene101449_741, partial [Candidatus Peregrinibacteria bacterium Greene1014_49]
MNQICSQCSAKFEIAQADLAFLDKVSPLFGGKKYTIPSPKLCPDCRQQRRLAFRNERHLYHRKCDKTGRQIISVYSPDKPFPVYEQAEWWGDSWNPLDFGRAVDFNRPFSEQFQELMRLVPRRSLIYFQNENSEFTNVCSNNKNCYLLFSSDYNEECYFVSSLQKCHRCVDCSNCYDSFDIHTCQQCVSCADLRNCSSCSFCMDCSGCSACLFSWGLRNKRHCILNEQYSPEEYTKKAQELRTGSYAAFSAAQREFAGVRLNCIRKAVHSVQSEECIGDYLQNCKACVACFNALDSQDCRYMYDGVSCKDCGDCNEMGYSELCYDVVEAFPEAYSVLWSFLTANTSDMQYCDHCYNSKHLFGCVGIRKGEYCILNKQYSKEEFEKLIPKIIEKMIVDGEWGEFLPVAMSPFAYNETVAQEAFPLTKGEAEKRGWQWRDAEEKQSQ